MGIKVDKALEVCNLGARMLRIAEKIEEGEIDVEGEKMVLSKDFEMRLNSKYENLSSEVEIKIRSK